jgi:hypothetical protein
MNYNDDKPSFVDDFAPFGARILFEAGPRFWFPFDYNSGFLAFINIGAGFGIDFIKYVLSPGIYVDIGIGMDWFYLFSDSDQKKDDYIPSQIFLSGGVRLYNVMNISDFYIIPHIGYNFMLFIVPFLNVGVSVSYRQWPFAIEYAYYPPHRSSQYGIQYTLHHIMFKISFNGKNVIKKI